MSNRNVSFHGVAMSYQDGRLVGVGPGAKQPIVDMAWQLLNEWDRVLVGGGGLGYTATRIAAIAAYTLVYEANPLLAEIMRAGITVEGGGEFKVRDAALAERDGFTTLAMSNGADWQQARIADLPGVKPQKGIAQMMQVRCDDINRIIKKQEINALALDVEGAEHALIHGLNNEAWGWLDKILLELHTLTLADEGASVRQCLADRGFIEVRSDVYFTTASLTDLRPTAQIRGRYLGYVHQRRLLPASAIVE